METTNTVIEVFKYGKYHADILKRETTLRFPNHPYSVKFIQETPKARYSTCKIIDHYVYKTIDEAITSAQNWINRIKTNDEANTESKRIIAEKNKAINASDFYKVGDFIVNSWGYEQTNTEFYIVTEVGNKTIKISEVYQRTEENSMYSHGMACNVLPTTNIIPDGDKYLLRVKDGGDLSHPKSYYYMHKWSGKPQYKSWYA